VSRSFRYVLRLAAEPALLAPVAPFEAYREDVMRLADRAPIGPADDAWLVTAHTLSRAASLAVADRADLLVAGGDAVRSVVEATRAQLRAKHGDDELAGRALTTAAAAGEALDTFGRMLRDGVDVAARDRALDALQQLAADEERTGAFLLAVTTLRLVREALAPALDARSEGLVLTQQGRAARQLGAIEAARELYGAAVRVARRGDAPEVTARAQLGLGVVANMRGNYPEARTRFRRAVSAARRAGSTELRRAAHQGLFCAAIAARDADTALAHGWAAVRQTSAAAPHDRAESLANLAAAARLAGAPRAALGACLAALELTDLARIRLPVLGTAVRAAAELGEQRLVAFLLQDVERTIARSGQPFENAHTLVEIAETLHGDDDPQAVDYARRGLAIAEAGAFHELRLRAEHVLDSAAGAHHASPTANATPRHPVPPASPSARTRAVLRSLETLPGARRYVSRLA
jgi:tetratricopeptide (TPR) repeat protein